MSQTTTQTTHLDELSQIIGTEQVKTINGIEIAIKPFKVKALPEVMRAVQPIAHLVMQQSNIDIPSLVMVYSDQCLTLTAALAGVSRDVIDEMEIDQVVDLFAALFEVNLDFFIQKVLPIIKKSARQVTEKIVTLTPTPQSTGQNVYSS